MTFLSLGLVRASYRRRGIGGMLARGLLDKPRSAGRLVTVNAAGGSAPFWQSLGFSPEERDGHTHVLARCVSPYR
jgi:GNAT superfamily N-acetyltransferase